MFFIGPRDLYINNTFDDQLVVMERVRDKFSIGELICCPHGNRKSSSIDDYDTAARPSWAIN